MNTGKTLMTALLIVIAACDSSNSPVAVTSAGDPDDLATVESTSGAVFSGSSVAVSTTLGTASDKFCDTGPLPSAGGSLRNSMANLSVGGVVTGVGLYCEAGGMNLRSHGEAGLRALRIAIGGNTIVADRVHSMVGARCPPPGDRWSKGHTTFNGLRINGRVVTVTGELSQRIALPNGFVLINEQSGSPHRTGRTVIALHVVINATEREQQERDRRLPADIEIGRTQTHIDCPL